MGLRNVLRKDGVLMLIAKLEAKLEACLWVRVGVEQLPPLYHYMYTDTMRGRCDSPSS